MTNPTPENDKNQPQQSAPDGSFSGDVGEVKADESIKDTEQSTSAGRNTSPPHEPWRLNLGGKIGEWWDSLKKAEVSNRLIALATIAMAVATIVTTYEIITSSGQTDRIVAASEKIQSALENSNIQNRRALRRILRENRNDLGQTLAQNQRQFEATLVEMKRQSKAMNNAATASSGLAVTANKALEAQTRPSVGIDGPIEAENADPKADHMILKIKFRNYGRSPAILPANPYFRLTTGGGHGGWCDDNAHRWTEVEKPLHEKGYGKHLDAVFPGNEGIIIDVYAPYEGAEFHSGKLILIGCIAYKSGTDAVYHTEVVYWVNRPEGRNVEFERRDTEPY